MVDLEAEIVSALEELGKYKMMYKNSKTHMAEFEEKNNHAERIIVDLKNQFLVAKNTENNLEHQLKMRIQEYERLEEEIMHLRKKLDEESIKSNFENNSRTLDEILSLQRPSSDKYGLGFDKEKPGYSFAQIKI